MGDAQRDGGYRGRPADVPADLMALFGRAPVVSAVLSGPAYLLETANAAFLATTGLTTEQLGRPIEVALPALADRTFLGLLAEASRSGESVSIHDVRMVHGPGTTREVFLDFTCDPHRGETGEVTGITLLGVETTELRQAQRLIDEHRALLEQVAADAPLERVLEGMIRVLESRAPDVLASVLLADEDGAHLRHGAGPRLPDFYNEAVDGIATGEGIGSCGTAAFRREPVTVTDIATDPLWVDFRDLAARAGLAACWSTPILAAGGRLLGTFAIYSRRPRAPQPADLALSAVFARTAALAIERHRITQARDAAVVRERLAHENLDAHVRLDRARRETEQIKQRYLIAREVTQTVQSSLLPEHLPVLPGVRLAAHYRVAGSEQAAGGDWFDAVPLADGRVALITGDVVGHGARASAVMGQLRAVLTAYLLDGYLVADALARLDRFVAGVPAATATTVCLAVLDPPTGRLSYASAGHPPPLLITARGEARYLPVEQGGPLGTAGAVPGVQETTLGPGDVLLLYTDGLLERPDRSLADGLEQLRHYASDALIRVRPSPNGHEVVDELCRRSLDRMLRAGHTDDVSVIAAQRISPTPSAFRVAVAASALSGLRSDLGRWLDELGADLPDQQKVQLAVGEAVTNSIDHAYPCGVGIVVVEGYLDPAGRVCMTVSDEGVWRAPPAEPDSRGRGLIMIRSCMDTVEMERSEFGTTLLMDHRLRRRPVFSGADLSEVVDPPAGRGRPPDTAYEAVLERSDRPLLRVRGPVDSSTSGQFHSHLREASRGGTLPLELDLTAVTHLASTGVQLLHELAEQMAADAQPLLVTAPPGSPARHVLELTGLDQLITVE